MTPVRWLVVAAALLVAWWLLDVDWSLIVAG